MSDWIVANIPSWQLLALLVILVSGGAVLIKIYIRHRFPALRKDSQNDITKFAFGVIGFVYAFFIGFLANAMWGQITSADNKAIIEGSAAMQIARTLVALDKPDSDRLRQSLLEYMRAAKVEWNLVAKRQSHTEADDALQRLYEAFRTVQARDDTQSRFLSIAMGNLDTMSTQRTQRVTVALTDVGPPWSLWAVIFLTSGLVLGCAIIYGGGKAPMQYVMTGTIGVLVATNLFLILELSHPYVGEIATSSEPLVQVINFLAPPES